MVPGYELTTSQSLISPPITIGPGKPHLIIIFVHDQLTFLPMKATIQEEAKLGILQ